MGSQVKPTTRRYTVEQKEQAVRLVRKIRAETGQAHGAVKRVAAQLGYGVESVRSWVKQATEPAPKLSERLVSLVSECLRP